MFKNLSEEIKLLNSDVKTVANCEKAKKLRKRLLSIGIPLAVVGFVGAFVLMGIIFLMPTNEASMQTSVILSLIIFPLFFMGGIGASITAYGLKIAVVGYTTNLVDETVGNVCLKCGDKIESDELFCSKCGEPVKKVCPNCKTINDIKSSFCKNCGTKLD